jgi:S1-C subfamily serine protease
MPRRLLVPRGKAPSKQKRRLLPAIAVGSSTGLKVGQSAYAIGSPYGLDQSLTTGVISGLKRELPTTRRAPAST